MAKPCMFYIRWITIWYFTHFQYFCWWLLLASYIITSIFGWFNSDTRVCFKSAWLNRSLVCGEITWLKHHKICQWIYLNFCSALHTTYDRVNFESSLDGGVSIIFEENTPFVKGTVCFSYYMAYSEPHYP